MVLSPQRKGQIAVELVKHRWGKEGLIFTKDTRRKIGQVAKDTGIPLEELVAFIEQLILELLADYVTGSREDKDKVGA